MKEAQNVFARWTTAKKSCIFATKRNICEQFTDYCHHWNVISVPSPLFPDLFLTDTRKKYIDVSLIHETKLTHLNVNELNPPWDNLSGTPSLGHPPLHGTPSPPWDTLPGTPSGTPSPLGQCSNRTVSQLNNLPSLGHTPFETPFGHPPLFWTPSLLETFSM